MKFIDWVLIAAVLAAVCLAIWRMNDRKKKGKGCCGTCASCRYGCKSPK